MQIVETENLLQIQTTALLPVNIDFMIGVIGGISNVGVLIEHVRLEDGITSSQFFRLDDDAFKFLEQLKSKSDYVQVTINKWK